MKRNEWFFTVLLCAIIACQVMYAQQPLIKNPRWSFDGNFVQVLYDLEGDLTHEYEISLLLCKENDESFKVKPKRVFGDCGDQRVGVGKRILWEFQKDIAERPPGEGYFFIITAGDAEARTHSGTFLPSVLSIAAKISQRGNDSTLDVDEQADVRIVISNSGIGIARDPILRIVCDENPGILIHPAEHRLQSLTPNSVIEGRSVVAGAESLKNGFAKLHFRVEDAPKYAACETTLTIPTRAFLPPRFSVKPAFWKRSGETILQPVTAKIPRGDSISINFNVKNIGSGIAESLHVSAQESSRLLAVRLAPGDSMDFSLPVFADDGILEDSLGIDVYIGEKHSQCFLDTALFFPLAPVAKEVGINVPQPARPTTFDASSSSDRSAAQNFAGPRLLKTVEPVYPPEALSQGIEGGVRVRVEVGVDGKVKNATVLESPSELLIDPVIKAVRQYEFTPTGIGMNLTNGILEIVIRFSLPKTK
jgi:TonB family protein